MKNRSLKFAPLKIAAASLIAVGSLAAMSAHAEGLYVGGNIGAPHFGDPINGVGNDSGGVAGKIYGGYQLTPNFALEAGAATLGHTDDPFGRAKGHGVFVDAVGIVPVAQDWSLLGRIGVAHVDLNTSNGDDNGAALKIGAGAQYAISTNTALRAEWERYRPDAFGTRTNIDQYTVGVKFSF